MVQNIESPERRGRADSLPSPLMSASRRTIQHQVEPITTCHRGSSDYDSGRLEFPRHMSNITRGATSPATTATTPIRTSRGTETFVCPVVDCPNPTATRGDNMRRHIRQKHPESVHAQILEAALKKTKITLPPPPSVRRNARRVTSGARLAAHGVVPRSCGSHLVSNTMLCSEASRSRGGIWSK
jgi:hypothetical protein